MPIATKELPLFIPQNAKSPLDYYVQAREQGDVVKVSVGSFQTYVLSNPEHIREVVVAKQDHFIKGIGLQELKVLVGEGILTSEKAQHRQDRQVMQPFFNMQYIGSMENLSGLSPRISMRTMSMMSTMFSCIPTISCHIDKNTP